MTALIAGEIAAGGNQIILVAAGDDFALDRAAAALRKMTPLLRKTDPPGALAAPLTWATVTQLGHAFSGNGLGQWAPGPRLSSWIQAEFLRRTAMGAEIARLVLPEGLVPRQYQRAAAAMIATTGKFLLCDDPGPQPVTTPVWTPDGWRQLGNLVPGDIVYDSHGQQSIVQAVKRQGIVPCYRVTFSDRTSTLATAQHQWHVWTRNDRHHPERRYGLTGRMLSTQQLLRAGLKNADGSAKFYLPQQPALNSPERKLPLDPYVYGALLGDGSLGGEQLCIACPDNEVLHAVAGAALSLGTTWRWNTPANRCQNLVFHRDGKLRTVLAGLGALARSEGKHVHDRYLQSGTAARRALLAGLLDTDGSVANAAAAEYSSASAQLAADVAWLARSLGAVVTESLPQRAGYLKDGVKTWVLDRHRLSMRFPADGPNPFTLPRKADEWARQAISVQRRYPPRTFQSIEPAGERDVCCIGLNDDSTHVYLTDTALVPTHNTGKTCSTILGLLERQVLGVELFPMVILVPSWDVGDVWYRHVREWAPSWPEPVIYQGPGRAASVGETAKDDQVLLTTYATARLDAADASGPLARLKARCVVADEVHLCRNTNSKRSQALRRIASHAETFAGLSGTPVTRDTGDIYPVLAAMEPESWPSRERFIRRYCLTENNGYGESVLGLDPAAEPEFRAALLGQYRRVAKEDVLSQLPPKVYSVRRVEIPPGWQNAYDELEADMIAQLPDGEELSVMSVLAQLTRLSQLASSACDVSKRTEGNELGEEKAVYDVTMRAPSWKADALLEILAERPGQQVAVFTVSRQLAVIAGEACAKAGYRCGFILGGQGAKERRDDIAAFQAGDLDVIVATAGAGSLGISLTAAGTVVMLQRSWQLDQAVQSEDRAHRHGNDHEAVEVIDVIAKGTVDERVREVLKVKGGRLAEVVSDRRLVTQLLGGLR